MLRRHKQALSQSATPFCTSKLGSIQDEDGRTSVLGGRTTTHASEKGSEKGSGEGFSEGFLLRVLQSNGGYEKGS